MNSIELGGKSKISKNNPIILISMLRIVLMSSAFIIVGILVGFLSFWIFKGFREAETIDKIVAAAFLLGSVLFIYMGIRCLLISRVQLQFTDTGIKYRDVRKSVIGRNKTGIGLRFYLTKKNCFISYKDIIEVKVEKVWLQCSTICLVTRLNGNIFLPFLVDNCKQVSEIAGLINENIYRKR